MIYKIFADDELIHQSNVNDPDYSLYGITLDVEMGKAGSLNFTILPTHPFYNSLKNLQTMLEVYEDDYLLFRGRFFDHTIDFYKQKECSGEGDLIFLSDSVVAKGEYKESITALFTRYINEHNSRVEDYKKFTVGQITIDNATTETVESKHDTYQITSSLIEDELINSYGGYLRTRKVGTTNYIDYLKDYGTTSPQTIKFGVNLVDLSDAVSPEDVFSLFIPVGDNNTTISSVNNGSDYIEVPGAVAKWGKRYKIQTFSGISDTNTLLKEANLYIQNHYNAEPETITLTAIDLKSLGVKLESIHVGDKVLIQSEPHGLNKEYTCVSISYNISVPGKTQYVFGKPKQDFTKKYSQNSQSTSSELGSLRSGGAATASKLDQYIIATDDTLTLMHQNIELNAENIALNAEQIDLVATAAVDGFNTVAIQLDAVNAKMLLMAEKEYVDGEITTVSIALDAAEDRIDVNAGNIALNASEIVEINSQLTSINGDLEVLGTTITNEIDAVKSDISWMNGKTITAAGANINTAIIGTLSTTGPLSVAGTLRLNGATVSTTALTVVTNFTQASGETAPTETRTLLTTSVGNGVARQPLAGQTIEF